MRKLIIIALIGLLIYYKRDVLNTPIIPPNTNVQIIQNTGANTGNDEANADTGTQTVDTSGDSQSGNNNSGTQATVSTGPHISLSYEEVTDYIDANITDIVSVSDPIEPANGKWYADGYGFTSMHFTYVDYEDGHFLHRALLECKKSMDKKISCVSLAIFDKQKTRTVFQGTDTQKNNPIIYKHSKDYVRER